MLRHTDIKKSEAQTTNLSCSSDGQHKRRHRGAAQVQEATLRNNSG